MPVAYCCHQCKRWWLPLFLPHGRNANESCHPDHKIEAELLLSFYFIPNKRLEQSNATRASVAVEGLTEANLYLRLPAQMQTSLATWTKIGDPRQRVASFAFLLFPAVYQSKKPLAISWLLYIIDLHIEQKGFFHHGAKKGICRP